jgi:chemotaxis protein MotB
VCEARLREVNSRAQANDQQLVSMQGNLSATREELTTLRAQRIEAEKRLAAIAKIQAQFAKMVDTGQLKVSARRGSFVVELPAEVLFRSGSAELSEKGQLSVLEVGFILKQFADRRFLVVGHTDNFPLKNAAFADNWELSTARALTVTHVLVKAGMKPQMLMAAGAGEHDPVRSNARPTDRQRNRRIEIQLLPAITELPPLPATLSEGPASVAAM